MDCAVEDSVDDKRDAVQLVCVQSLSKQVTPADLEVGRVYPALKDIRHVSVRIAVDLVKYIYEAKLAMRMPEPENIDACVQSQLYSPFYATAAIVQNSS